MEKLTNMLRAIDQNPMIHAELASIPPGKPRTSNTMNAVIQGNYPQLFPQLENTKNMLLRVWNETIGKASRPRNIGAISRTYIKLFQALDPVVKLLYPVENTSEKVFVEFRKPVRERLGDGSEVYKQSTYLLGVSRERALARREEYANRVAERGLNRAEMKPVFDDEVYHAIDQGITSVDPLEKAIAVMLATASRFIEVLKVSEYTTTDERPYPKAQFIRVRGIAKDRANRGYENKVVIRGLVRLSPRQVIDAVKFIRENLDISGTNEEISNRYNSTANKRVKKMFPGHDLTVHKMRYIAANLAYRLYGRNGIENVFIQQYLGHEDGSVSRTYQAINVRLRNAPDPVSGFNRLDTTISELRNDLGQFKKRNNDEHNELRMAFEEMPIVEDIGGKKRKRKPVWLYGVITRVDFPDLVNPPQRTTEQKKFELLDEIFDRYKDRGILPKQNDLKKYYGFGSNLITTYYKSRGI